MATWRIVGVDKTTGQERTLLIEAADEADAISQASAAGTYIASLKPVSGATSTEGSTEEGEILDRPAPAPTGAGHRPAESTGVARRVNGSRPYFLLDLSSRTVQGVGFGYAAIAGIAVLLSVFEAIKYGSAVAAATLIFAGTAITIGAGLVLFGSIGRAVRDIARSNTPPHSPT